MSDVWVIEIVGVIIAVLFCGLIHEVNRDESE